MNFAVTFPGLPAGYCYTGDLNALFQAALSISFVSISDSYTQIIVNETTPAPADQNKIWVQINGSGTPLGIFRYASGTWQRIQGAPYYAVDSGVVNAFSVSFPSDFTITALADLVGRVFLVKASTATTGPATIQVNGLPATALTYFASPIKAGHITSGSIFAVVYDGTSFQVISALPPVGLITTLGYCYNQTTPQSGTENDVTITLSKPTGSTWQEFGLFVDLAAATDSGRSITCIFTFETVGLMGVAVTTKEGVGNSGQRWEGTVDNDSVLAHWHWTAPVPTELLNETTLYFKASFTITGAGGVSSIYAGGRGTFLTTT